MPHIARLDEQGMLLAVEDCRAEDHKTCPIARTVALPEGHDAAERDTPELVEGLVQAIEHIQQLMQLDLPKTSRRSLQNYRRRNPRRTPEVVEPTAGEPA